MTNQTKIILSLAVLLVAFIGVTLFVDIGVIKWFNCSSPFAAPQDKASDVCKELKNSP
ncbi:hypothetical protein IQ264_05150 [Phormidium sp. LEGE 05292]|uniref:hypothetical protein n=1 Tax=[Phormidium] sp. LEGE 05292 TaxID=767427 RepID=UPI001880F685|nr:hypothetical protein [Phormidium sp. LEGE 05292]MBE9224853.1 hypothetical protein [Phormidium sp. LEGE 05292]